MGGPECLQAERMLEGKVVEMTEVGRFCSKRLWERKEWKGLKGQREGSAEGKAPGPDGPG